MSACLQSLCSMGHASPADPSEDPSTISSKPVMTCKRGVSQVEPPNTVNQNNQPGTTSSTMKAKKARTTKQDESSGEPEPHNQPAAASKRTRTSNNEHPALRPGVLTKLHESREEIAARTTAKRVEDEAKRETKRAKEETGKANIAAAMNVSEWEAKEREEKSKLPFGGNIEVAAFNGGFDARAM